MIKEDCGVDKWVWPLVVFVGDWRVKNDWRSTDTRVFTTDTLGRHIASRQPELTRREIDLIASHLERSAKSSTRVHHAVNSSMANPQIQQVVDTMWWKLVPWILLVSFIGTFAGVFVKWLERKATEVGRKRRRKAELRKQVRSQSEFRNEDSESR